MGWLHFLFFFCSLLSGLFSNLSFSFVAIVFLSGTFTRFFFNCWAFHSLLNAEFCKDFRHGDNCFARPKLPELPNFKNSYRMVLTFSWKKLSFGLNAFSVLFDNNNPDGELILDLFYMDRLS